MGGHHAPPPCFVTDSRHAICHGSFDYATAPIQLRELLESYSLQIDSLRMEGTTERRFTSGFDEDWVVVAPLLKTTWSQWDPYNWFCPDGCPTGCTNTALAQIMYYYQWPPQAHPYVVSGGEQLGATTVYDWANMPLSQHDAGNATSMAQLMADIGRANCTRYTAKASYAYPNTDALATVFGYNLDCQMAYFYNDESKNLADSLKHELDAGHPVLYSGHPASGDGHAFVCDGYSVDDYFHFNFGWEGEADGFYRLGATGNYCYNIAILQHFYPWSASTALVEQGNMQFTIEDDEATLVRIYGDFEDIYNRQNITLPDDIEVDGRRYPVTRIGARAFQRAYESFADTLTLGRYVRSVGKSAFAGLDISTLILNDSLRVIGDGAFYFCEVPNLTIGRSPLRIGKEAFRMCSLAHVTCNSPVIDLDEMAMAETKPDGGKWVGSIRSIGKRAFRSASFGSAPYFTSLETIGPEAFWGASGAPRFSEHLREVAPNAFELSSMYSIVVDPANPWFTSFNSGTRAGTCIYTRDTTTLVTTVPEFRLDNMWGHPIQVVKINPGAIPTHYKGEIDIPYTMVEMTGAFTNCTQIGRVICHALVPPVLTDDSFNEKMLEDDPFLQVPSGTREAYMAAPGWRRFKKIGERSFYAPALELEREHYMLTHHNDSDSRDSYLPVSQIEEMAFMPNGTINLRMRGDADVHVSDMASVDSITWKDGFLMGSASVFPIDEDHLSAEIRECSVTFDSVSIDGPTQVCMQDILSLPEPLNVTNNLRAVDISLAGDVHELTGTATIAIHMP